MRALRLSDLHVAPALAGTESGVCSVCGLETESGHTRQPSESFNAWDLVRGGFFCEWCWGMLKHRPIRLHSWVATTDEARFFSGPELPELARVLFDPPVPCVAYISRSHRKQAWVALGRRVSTDRHRLWIATDWTGTVMVDGSDPTPLELAEALLARGVRRSTLRTGRPTPAECEKALRGGWMQDLQEALARAGDPVWEVWVHVARRPS